MLLRDDYLQNRYRIVRQLGQGGMGHVYEAVDENVTRTIAIKERLAEADSEKLRRAFEHEAKLLASLRHRALPHVTDYFIEGKGQFLVMEYIGGENLADLLTERKAPIPYQEVMRWADSLLDALEYLHGQFVIHRDIKPANIKLTDEGKIYLLDFGLAKGESGSMTSSVPWHTVAYAPLEQLNNAGTTVQSDLYSLGATLYHLLTGEPPTIASQRHEQVVEQEQRDPLIPAHELYPAVPLPLSLVVSSAMTILKKNRIASASQMRDEIQAAGRAIEIEAARQREQVEAEKRRREQEEAEQRRQEQEQQRLEGERIEAAQRAALLEQQRQKAARQREAQRATAEREQAEALPEQKAEALPEQKPVAPLTASTPEPSSVNRPPSVTTGIGGEFSLEDWQAFVGKNYPYYFRKWEKMDQAGRTGSFNVAAFFLGVFWMFYRKMYFYSALLLLFFLFQTLIEAAANVEKSPFAGLNLIIALVIFSRGNSIYRQHVRKKLSRIKARGLDPATERALIEKEGGTSLLQTLAMMAVFILLIVGIYMSVDSTP